MGSLRYSRQRDYARKSCKHHPLLCISSSLQHNNNYLDTVNDKPLLSEMLTLGEKNKNSAFNLKLLLFCKIKEYSRNSCTDECQSLELFHPHKCSTKPFL